MKSRWIIFRNSFYWNKEGIIDFDFNFANAGYCNVVSSDVAFTYFSNLWYTNVVWHRPNLSWQICFK